MKGLFGIFNPRELQDTKNRIASRNERDLNDYASKPLPESFDVVIYSDSAETGQTATSTVGNSNTRHPSNFKWYRVKSLAGHNDMLPEPSDSSGVDREANIQVFFQGYYPLNETNHPKEGDVWSAILEGGNLVRLDKYIRDGEITRRASSNSKIKEVDNSNDKKTVGEYIDNGNGGKIPTLEELRAKNPKIRKPIPSKKDGDEELAKIAGIPLAVLRAIRAVESSGNPSSIRFEPHKWYNVKKTNPPKGFTRNNEVPYSLVAGETNKNAFEAAYAIDKDLAVRSTSFGSYQVLGGKGIEVYGTSEKFWEQFKIKPEEVSDKIMAQWFSTNKKAKEAANNLDFTKLAEAYNGPEQAKQHYDSLLLHAYQEALKL